jgi:hypothetical protein
MRKPNYQQVRKQKEQSRKARQQEKQLQRNKTRPDGTEEGSTAGAPDEAATAVAPTFGSGT